MWIPSDLKGMRIFQVSFYRTILYEKGVECWFVIILLLFSVSIKSYCGRFIFIWKWVKEVKYDFFSSENFVFVSILKVLKSLRNILLQFFKDRFFFFPPIHVTWLSVLAFWHFKWLSIIEGNTLYHNLNLIMVIILVINYFWCFNQGKVVKSSERGRVWI